MLLPALFAEIKDETRAGEGKSFIIHHGCRGRRYLVVAGGRGARGERVGPLLVTEAPGRQGRVLERPQESPQGSPWWNRVFLLPAAYPRTSFDLCDQVCGESQEGGRAQQLKRRGGGARISM